MKFNFHSVSKNKRFVQRYFGRMSGLHGHLLWNWMPYANLPLCASSMWIIRGICK